MIAEGMLLLLFAIALNLPARCVEISKSPGNPDGSGTIAAVVKNLTIGATQEIAAGSKPACRIELIEASDQSHPRLLKQILELLWSALLLASSRAVGQTEVLKHQLIAPRNACGQ